MSYFSGVIARWYFCIELLITNVCMRFVFWAFCGVFFVRLGV